MSLIGECEDCGIASQLRYKPGLSMSEQSRPTICSECRYLREELVNVGNVRRRGFDYYYEVDQ